jgi:hypothetical protein
MSMRGKEMHIEKRNKKVRQEAEAQKKNINYGNKRKGEEGGSR